jgi:hypothetical protein
MGDSEGLEKDSKEEPKKEQPCSNAITPSQPLFKIKEKVDIKPYQCEIIVVNLNHWLQHLEVYFSVHNIDEEHKIPFSQLKIEDHAQTWWGSHMETLRLEGDQ